MGKGRQMSKKGNIYKCKTYISFINAYICKELIQLNDRTMRKLLLILLLLTVAGAGWTQPLKMNNVLYGAAFKQE